MKLHKETELRPAELRKDDERAGEKAGEKPGEKGRTARQRHGRWYADACGAAYAMELIGERWSLPVAREMMLGPRRFSELRASLPGISAKTLTERLETLEMIGVVEKTRLPPPASVGVYRLTDWGRALEPVMQELGRWAVRSPKHDPSLPLTPVAFMLSLRTMLVPEHAAGLALWLEFDVAGERFAGRLRGGELAIRPAAEPLASPDLRMTAPSASDFLPVIYGKRCLAEAGGGLAVEGDPALFARFVDCFALPDKVAMPG